MLKKGKFNSSVTFKFGIHAKLSLRLVLLPQDYMNGTKSDEYLPSWKSLMIDVPFTQGMLSTKFWEPKNEVFCLTKKWPTSCQSGKNIDRLVELCRSNLVITCSYSKNIFSWMNTLIWMTPWKKNCCIIKYFVTWGQIGFPWRIWRL